jgi:lysophospholipase L1-like esterase
MLLYKIVALITFPLLVLQGKKVRKTALKLPEADGERAGGPSSNNASSSQTPLSLLIMGDSAAAGVGATHQDEALLGNIRKHLDARIGATWRLIAESGMQTRDMLAHAEANLSENEVFDVVVLSLGVNDVTSFCTSKTRLNSLRALCEFCTTQLHAKHIIISGMPPMGKFPLLPQPLRYVLGARATHFDRQQEAYVKKHNRDVSDGQSEALSVHMYYLPMNFEADASAMAQDGFHPGPHIYEQWGKAVADIVNQQVL